VAGRWLRASDRNPKDPSRSAKLKLAMVVLLIVIILLSLGKILADRVLEEFENSEARERE
jgi:hypothetical protein